MEKIIGLKEFRETVGTVAVKVKQGDSFIVVKRSKPLFRVAPLDREEEWEEVIDFTKIRKNGVSAELILKYLRNEQNSKKLKQAKS